MINDNYSRKSLSLCYITFIGNLCEYNKSRVLHRNYNTMTAALKLTTNIDSIHNLKTDFTRQKYLILFVLVKKITLIKKYCQNKIMSSFLI